MKAKAIMFAAGVPAILLVLFVSGCHSAPGDAKKPAPMPVNVSYPVQRKVTEYSELTGRTAAVDSIEVRARVWGYVDRYLFKEGMLVQKGDVLFEIDPRPYKAALAQAVGKLASAEARAQRLNADFARAQRLVKTNSIAYEEYDRVTGDLAEAKAAIEAQKAAVDQAKLDLDFTKVTASVSGRVGRALVTEGNLVQAGPTGGTLLTTLVSVDPIYAYFDVDERTVLRVRQMIREGKVQSARDVTWPVYLGLANEDGFPHEGTINFVDNQINPKVGTLRLRGVFANKDETLSPGNFVRVRIPIGLPHDAILISDRAVDSDQGQKIVYVVESDNTVGVRQVRLDGLFDGLRAVESGLSMSDRVLVTGQQHVRPGMSVTPTVVEMPVSK
jgi:multidrug efflux system membrane fusion protein